jgi:hypothetical protein
LGFVVQGASIVPTGMGTRSALEHYFPRLLGTDGSGLSSSAGAASLIASSVNDVEKLKRALDSVCPAQRKRKLPQPHSNPQQRCNLAVKLLTPSVDAQNLIDAPDVADVQNVTNKGRKSAAQARLKKSLAA